MVLGSVLISLFTHRCPVFPAPFIEEPGFGPLYIVASFVKNKVPQVHGFVSGLSILLHWSVFLVCASTTLC